MRDDCAAWLTARRLNAPSFPRVLLDVIRKLRPVLALGVLALACTAIGFASPKIRDVKLDALLHGVEEHYNRARTLSVTFTENYIAGGREKRTESGTLDLRKPGRMRWTYSSPQGKIFLSDGKHFFLYTPDTQRVEKTSFRDADDLHAPLAFLLGKLNFYKEFSGFELHGEGDDLWIAAEPNSATLPYSKVEFLVTTDSRIRRMRVTTDDLSILDFHFEAEKINPALPPDLFVFHVPAGAELEDNSR